MVSSMPWCPKTSQPFKKTDQMSCFIILNTRRHTKIDQTIPKLDKIYGFQIATNFQIVWTLNDSGFWKVGFRMTTVFTRGMRRGFVPRTPQWTGWTVEYLRRLLSPDAGSTKVDLASGWWRAEIRFASGSGSSRDVKSVRCRRQTGGRKPEIHSKISFRGYL